MAEETKTQNEKKGKGVVKSAVKVILGVALIVFGLLAVIIWWTDLWAVVRGVVGLFLLLAGAITIAIAKE